MSLDMNQTPVQVQRASPQLVAANHILALSSADLQSLINKEIIENPALEMEETPICPTCGRALQGNVCTNCVSAAQPTQQVLDHDDYLDDAALWQFQSTSGGSEDEEFDPTTHVAAQMSLAEHLTLSLQAQLPSQDAPIVEYLVGNLDDDGLLRCSVEEVVHLFEVPLERVERAIIALQAMEPIGVGARDVRECLLIQLAYVEAQGIYQPYAREIISRYLPQLSEHKYGQIASQLGITSEMVHQVSEFIKRNLNPYPARGYLGTHLGAGGDVEHVGHVMPDVIITRRPIFGGYQYDVEVVESKRFYLHVSSSYSQLYGEVSGRHSILTEDERRHIQQYVSRAKLFIANINQRRQTLSKITRCLVDMQKDYLDKGIRALRPLTRAKVATELGMHESTVSRATAAKFVMLPNREVIPFSNFFVANLSVKDVIKDLIVHELTPLTDQELADMLSDRGIQVARRTVAKYREQLGILPSSLR
ncbi:MAG TPA: RNA polymerase factor sigma-54 [Ktedonobacterales bacterium]